MLTKNRKALITAYKSMGPENRLMAFLNHSRLIHQLYQAGKTFRSSLPMPTIKTIFKK